LQHTGHHNNPFWPQRPKIQASRLHIIKPSIKRRQQGASLPGKAAKQAKENAVRASCGKRERVEKGKAIKEK